MREERWMQGCVMLACILFHIGIGAWLIRPSAKRQSAVVVPVFYVDFIAPAITRSPPPPPFPQAPARHSRSNTRLAIEAAPSIPVTASPAPALQESTASPSLADWLEAAERAVHDEKDAFSSARRNPVERRAVRLPGRAESYTPKAITLRDPITPAVVVASIGKLFGGDYQPCPDIRSKLRDLAARNDPRFESELQVLINQERARCRPQ